MSSGKRRRSVLEENRAQCPFTIALMDDPSQAGHERQRAKKRKCEGQKEQDGMQSQSFPFSTGAFNTHTTLDLCYFVEPEMEWQSMRRYNSFVPWQSTRSSITRTASSMSPTSALLSDNKR
ncbi:hypothetical protein EDB80DRAFT_255191 [Ilyonectria destructans]|nr:hypothetical protein EDB80DRAFT_255191 [Ilyonectria destructans]